ncbi:hypothetical protein NP493_1818g00029 [Ridgeia piscesae]|uniref:Uncharacterized protein n=1 Tax=Ridgeia piscesae TaxID=27915 RepID=A0AAD9N643_RIDPI|nr:hypothetical protein NP493_1818g00029 [Ridgeia piscesae]
MTWHHMIAPDCPAGHFGGGVLTYFLFLRWLLKVNFYLFVLTMLFVTLPFNIWRSNVPTTYYNNSERLGFNDSYDGCIDIHVDAFGGAVQFSYNVPLAYIFTIIGCLAISLFNIIHRCVQCSRR